MKRLAILATVIAVVMLGSEATRGWYYQGPLWRTGSRIVMEMQLGRPSRALMDGSTSWNTSAERSLAAWNEHLDDLEFRVNRESTAATGLGNGRNNLFWSATVYGKEFDSYASESQNSIAGVTVCWQVGGYRTECDVVLRNTKSWNSYNGRRVTGVIDIRRLTLHEFGHVINLKHPNDHGQTVNAIMNSTTSDLDRLQNDDIAGARYLWGQ